MGHPVYVTVSSLPIHHFVISLHYRNRAQKSVPIRLVRRRVYFMEALMKEGGGGDHISVAMKIGRRIKPIPAKYLYVVPPGMR